MTENSEAAKASVGRASACRVILHRLSLDERKQSLLERSGIEVIRARSVREVCEAVDGAAGERYVLVDLSVGSNAPEKIWRYVETCRSLRPQPITFIACSTSRSTGSKRRAAQLGLREVFLWPEGAFGQLMRRLAMLPDVTLHRLAERAAVNDGISAQPGLEFEGGLVNISASGAMIECGVEHEELTGLTFEINIFDHATDIEARVRWRERFVNTDGVERLRMGVEFVSVSETAREAIDRFVRHTNVIPIRGPSNSNAKREGSAARVRVRARRGTRADFFLLEGDLEQGAMLVPRRSFFVPYELGDVLLIDILTPRVRGEVAVEIIGREMLDEGRVDGRVGWRIRLQRAAAGTALRDGSVAVAEALSRA